MKPLLPLSLLFLSACAWLPDLENENAPALFRRHPSRVFPRTLPSAKVRGVNLGSLFIIEPWMAGSTWSGMGCGGFDSEADCVQQLGQDAANEVFQNHWNTWITQDDLQKMASYGLNTIRVPVGYWMREDLVADGEFFPQGGFGYLKQVCNWATSLGFYIIIDLHGAPGAQQATQPFTGQYASTANFYNNEDNFERAYKFLEWMATQIHSDSASFGGVGMIEILNEPVQGNSDLTGSMISEYYPTAASRIRAAESALNVSTGNQLHIQVMDSLWGSGNPGDSLSSDSSIAFDDHEYLKWNPGLDKTDVTPQAYLDFACQDDRGSDGESPKVVGEWSLSIDDDHQNDPDFAANSDNAAYYAKLFAAQQQAYEKQAGWVYWSWKAELGDYRWSYSDAVAADAIPSDLDASSYSNVC